MAFSPAQVRVFAPCGPRVEHLDAKGGGTITRAFYVEPYISYPWVELFLKGTVVNTGGANWARIKPHADPIKPWFYCSDVQVHPFAPETVTGQAVAAFTPNADFGYSTGAGGGQQQQINNVLSNVDDHSFQNIVDFGLAPPLTNSQVSQGGIQYPAGSSSFPPVTGGPTSSGKCGAYVIATYTPLIFLDGNLPSNADQFDVINPVRVPEAVVTQTGRSLFLYSQNVVQAAIDNPQFLGGAGGLNLVLTAIAAGAKAAGVVAGNGGNAGLSDTFGRSEIIWRFSIKRAMVPFLPQLTIGAYKDKVNQINNATLGNLKFPKWTIRFDNATDKLQRGPDGATWYDLTLHFSIRLLWEDVYDDLPDGTTIDGAGFPALKSIKNWVTWNHAYGIPADRVLGIQIGSAGYYPVIWNGGAFQLFGNPRTVYLGDGQVQQPPGYAGTFTGNMLQDLFTSGFQLNQ